MSGKLSIEIIHKLPDPDTYPGGYQNALDHMRSSEAGLRGYVIFRINGRLTTRFHAMH